MKLEGKPTGREFLNLVAASVGKNLRFERWVEILYDVLEDGREGGAFEDLAFEAKAFHSLKRALVSGTANNTARKKVEVEIENALRRFSELLWRASNGFNEIDREEFRRLFLDTAGVGNTIALLDDFSTIKDFYLKRRDTGYTT